MVLISFTWDLVQISFTGAWLSGIWFEPALHGTNRLVFGLNHRQLFIFVGTVKQRQDSTYAMSINSHMFLNR